MASPVKDTKTFLAGRGFTEVIGRGRGHLIGRNPANGREVFVGQTGDRGWHVGDGPYTVNDEIDTAWVDADPILDAPWLKKMVLSDYHAYFGPGSDNLDSGQIVRYVHPASGEDITFELQQLQWTNDLNQISAIADPSSVSPTSVNDDTVRWDDCFDSAGTPITGLNFRWETQTTRLSKFLEIESLSTIGSPPQFIIDGGNPVLKLGFIFQKSNNVDVYVNGQLWNESSQQTTSNNIEFRLTSTQETLWYFKLPLVTDSFPQGNLANPQMVVKKTGPNLVVEIRTPWSWLETATYPVEIDPTVEPQVAAESGEGFEASTGTMDITSTTHLSNGQDEWLGWHWPTVTIPSGATIDTAYVDFVFHLASRDEPDHTIDAEDAQSPSGMTTTSNDISSRTGTTATVTWTDNDLGGSAGGWVSGSTDGPAEIKTIIQELVDSYSYVSGAAMMIRMVGLSGAPNLANRTWEYSSSNGGKLHIEYTASGTDNLTASGVATSPVVGQPTIGQKHALSATGVSTTPTIGTPTLTEVVDLDATGVSTTPEVDNPTIGQEHALSATGVSATPEVDTPTIGQEHALSATGVSTTPEVGNPVLAQEGEDNLDANGVSTTPQLDTPSIGQIHDLTATGVAATPEVGTPTLEHIHDLDATGVSTTPEVETPTLQEIHNLDADSVTTTPVVGNPVLAEEGEDALDALGVTATPVIGSPTLGQIHALSADGVITIPVVTTPTIGQVHILTATGVITIGLTSEPSIGQIHILTPVGVESGPVVGAPGLDTYLVEGQVEVIFEVFYPEIEFSIGMET